MGDPSPLPPATGSPPTPTRRGPRWDQGTGSRPCTGLSARVCGLRFHLGRAAIPKTM